jgi:excinuclease ABC subunit C
MIDLSALPGAPGCYLFKDAGDRIIYVGKAKNLRKRVSSYFRKHDHDPKTARLVEGIGGLDYIVTDNEVEALILENTLIKKHLPKFNIDLKDSKNFAYIHLSEGEFPRIGIARNTKGSGTFFGPFVSARERDYILSVVRKVFQIRSCRRLTKRACLRWHIGSCSAPCIGRISPGAYAERVRRAESVLRGNTRELTGRLRREMAEQAAAQEFELAMETRDQIAAIEHLGERQHVERQKQYDEDIVNYLVRRGRVYLMLFHVHKGTLSEKQEFDFDDREDVLAEFLVQYYGENVPPKELILPEETDEAVAAFLARLRGSTVRITVPQRGEKKKLLELVQKNIEIRFFGDRLKVEALKKRIGLPDLPVVIECFDISHLAGTAMVGSMVQFRCGKPDKKNYRRFRIKSVDRIDDFAAIGEVVRRRYARLLKEGGGLPDLVIVDGGKGQLSAALAELDRLGVKIPVISIAKREEEIYLPGMPLPLPLGKRDKASLYIQEIRDEAHRFAIGYNRLLRKKAVVS